MLRAWRRDPYPAGLALMAAGAGSNAEAGVKNDVRQSRPLHSRTWWHITAADAWMHATVTAVVLWAIAALILTSGSSYRSVFGSLKGTDFVHFYTLAHVDAKSAPAVLYDLEALHGLQTLLVPDSAPERYLPVYPPHTGLLFRPFAALSYGMALASWIVIIAGGYALCLWLAWRPFRSILTDGRLVGAAAAAFPPFWNMVLHGQVTLLLMLAFCLGWMALERKRPFWAGAAFGLLLVKPQFAIVLAAVVVCWREWRMMLGAAASIVLQIAMTVAAFGVATLRDYAVVVSNYRGLQGALESRPAEMHSLTAITNHLPGFLGPVIWAAGAIVIVTFAVRAWGAPAPTSLRMACLVLASLLVNPHVNSYDVTVLALPLIWYAGWVFRQEGDDRQGAMFTGLVYGTYVTLMLPTSRVVPGLQVSVAITTMLFLLMTRAALHSRAASPVRPVGAEPTPAIGSGGPS